MKYELLPEGIRGGMQRYLEQGIEPGSFLSAVLQNDLKHALAYADINNRQNLFEIVSWLWSYAPSEAWGSPRRFEAWIDTKLQVRLENEATGRGSGYPNA